MLAQASDRQQNLICLTAPSVYRWALTPANRLMSVTVKSMFSRSRVLAGVISAVLLCVMTATHAETRGRPAGPSGWRIGVGLAPIASPVFEGADNYGFSVSYFSFTSPKSL